MLGGRCSRPSRSSLRRCWSPATASSLTRAPSRRRRPVRPSNCSPSNCRPSNCCQDPWRTACRLLLSVRRAAK
eukprot:1968141-Pyramimonas_sp.AAC.1